MACVKGVGEPIETKDLFDFIYPDGYIINPLFNADVDSADYDGTDDDGISTVMGMVTWKQYQYYVTYSNCGKMTGSNKATPYGNPVDHAMKRSSIEEQSMQQS